MTVLNFPTRTQHLALPPGDAGVRKTIEYMIKEALGDEGATNPEVRAFALKATEDSPDRDDRAQASAIYYAVKNYIRFRGEYSEVVQTPVMTLRVRAGDCDDYSTLIVALLRSIGIPARFDTVATSGRDFTHVFPLAGIRQGGHIVEWIALDATVPAATPGWRPSWSTREKVWGNAKTLGDEGPQAVPISQKAADVIAVARQIGTSAGEFAASLRNTGNTSTFNLQRSGSGVYGSFGTSPTVLAVGGLLAGSVLYALFRRGRY